MPTNAPTIARLQDPIQLPNGQRLANRFMKSALSEALGDTDHGPSERIQRLYTRWSNGGYGLVVTGNVMVDGRHLGEPGNIVIEDDRHLDSLRRWAKDFQDGGTPLWMQVNHPGRQANPLGGRNRPVAPSAIAAKVPGLMRPRALEDGEIRDIIDRYATTSAVAESAGFDGVQIHGAHGYLVTQFLSPLSNQRDDEWGGDPQRRRRFVIEVLRAIRNATNSSFSVGIKLNSADFQRGGFTEDESRDVVRALVDEGIDMIEVSGGSYEAPAMMGARTSTAEREAYFLDYARSVRDLAGDVPIAVTGGFRTAAAMEAAVASGDCDIVGLGRPTCLTPDAPNAILHRGLPQLPSASVKVGSGRSLLGRVIDLKAIDGALDLSWHTDQLHRMGDGKNPDPDRSWAQALAAMSLRNGPGAFRPKRG